MELGLWYDANYDQQLVKERENAAELCFELEHTRPSDATRRRKLLAALFPNADPTAEILHPVYCDYGRNVYIGRHCFLNHNCYLMDGAKLSEHGV
jgi:acetyltransferase-like isoleucine patch superfamily enzyme